MGSILPCCIPCGKAGGLQIHRCQGIVVGNYSFTLYALTLKPPGFCNLGVFIGSPLSVFTRQGDHEAGASRFIFGRLDAATEVFDDAVADR